MTHRFALIVFDWDGTLLDSEEQIVDCLFATCADLAMEAPERDTIKNTIGLGLPEALEMLFPGAGPQVHGRITETYRRHFLANRTPAVLFPGVGETIAELHAAGYLLGIATGKSRRGLERALSETGFQHLFHGTRCADESFSKPHPQMLLELMDELDVDPGETLMVGDTEYDMQMAANAGTAAVAVNYGVHDKDRLLRHGPLACIDAIGEIKQWLAGHSD